MEYTTYTLEKSEGLSSLIAALIAFHTEIGKIKKGSDNPFYKSKYAALPDILSVVDPILVKNGLVIIQMPVGDHSLHTTLAHTSGEFISSSYTMTPAKNDPQGIGSSITYQRRYALGAILSLNIDEDDDGNAASAPSASPMAKNAAGVAAQAPMNKTNAVGTSFQLHAKSKTAKGGWKLSSSSGTIFVSAEVGEPLVDGETYFADLLEQQSDRGTYYFVKGEIAS